MILFSRSLPSSFLSFFWSVVTLVAFVSVCLPILQSTCWATGSDSDGPSSATPFRAPGERLSQPETEQAAPSLDERLAQASSPENQATQNALIQRQALTPMVDKALVSLNALRDQWLRDVHLGVSWSSSPFLAGLAQNKELNAVIDHTEAHDMVLRALIAELKNPPPSNIDSTSFVRAQRLLIQDLTLYFLKDRFPTVAEQKKTWKATMAEFLRWSLSVSVAMGFMIAVLTFFGPLLGLGTIPFWEDPLRWTVSNAVLVGGVAASLSALLLGFDSVRYLRTDWKAVAEKRVTDLQTAHRHYSDVVAAAIAKNYDHPLVAALASTSDDGTMALNPTPSQALQNHQAGNAAAEAPEDCELDLYELDPALHPASPGAHTPTGVRVDLSPVQNPHISPAAPPQNGHGDEEPGTAMQEDGAVMGRPLRR